MPIHQKLLEVMKETGYVQKSSHNREQNYRFASEGAFIEHVRPAMLKHGVICYPLDIKQQVGLTPKGTQVLVQGSVTFRFVDADDGSYIDIEAPYSGADSTDKAEYKAMTGARKYALRQALMIETGDDPERDEKAPAEQLGTWTAPAPDPWKDVYSKMTIKDLTPPGQAAYADQIDKLGITNSTACKLLGVTTMKAFPDETLGSIIGRVAEKLADSNKAAQDKANELLGAAK